MSYLITPLAFIFILGSTVVLHEFGHFIVAKLFKIRVETFSVGFGPRIFGRKWGHTDYRLSAIPLGGYVKLGGDESNSPIEGAGAADIPESEMFNLRPRWQRILVALAGPVMNVLTAFAIPFAAALFYGVPVTPAPIVSYIAPGGAAEKAGLKSGDRIVWFNGAASPDWDTIEGDGLLSPDQDLPMIVERGNERVSLTIRPTSHTENGATGGLLDFRPDNGGYPVVVSAVTPGSPAMEAGLQSGDRLVSVDGESLKSAAHARGFIRDHNGQAIHLTVTRGSETRELTTGVRRLQGGLLGVAILDDFPLRRAKLGASAAYAYRFNVNIVRLTGKALGQVIARKRTVGDTLSGPIGIYRAASTQVERLGWDGVYQMIGFLSLNLGIFNLLPIPVLDGGAIFLLLIEGVLGLIGMTLSLTVRERIQQAGFVVVILLMVFVITNDVLKLTRGSSGDTKPAATSK